MKYLVYTIFALSFAFVLPTISFAQTIDSTSDFATLYIFHPKDGLRGIFSIHLGDSIICKSNYNSRDEIRIYKEGKAELWAKPKNKSSLLIDVRFGEKYFVKCRMLTVEKTTEMKIELVDSVKAKREYYAIRNMDSIRAIKELDTIQKRNTIYAEIGSQAGIYSINYDRLNRLNKKIKHSLSIGLALFPSKYDFTLIMPVSYNLLFGKKNNHLELGFGATIYFYKFYTRGNTNSPVDLWTYRKDYFLFASPKIGYRYQKLHGRFFFRATFCPIVNIVQRFGALKFKNASQYNAPSSYRFFEPWGFDWSWGPVLPWAGISFGYTFNLKKKCKGL